MNLISNIKNFLYDQEYFISIYDSSIHVYGFNKIIKFSSNELLFEFEKFLLNIKGDKLLVKRLLTNEVLIKGNIKSLNIINEKTNMD